MVMQKVTQQRTIVKTRTLDGLQFTVTRTLHPAESSKIRWGYTHLVLNESQPVCEVVRLNRRGSPGNVDFQIHFKNIVLLPYNVTDERVTLRQVLTVVGALHKAKFDFELIVDNSTTILATQDDGSFQVQIIADIQNILLAALSVAEAN